MTGRGIQYPFLAPEPGQWHSPWDEAKLEPWKEVLRHLMVWHAASDESSLTTISTEFIPFPDYGEGAKYSIFDNSVACAQWLRKTWEAARNFRGSRVSVSYPGVSSAGTTDPLLGRLTETSAADDRSPLRNSAAG